jgi:hypothetical protein
MILTASDPWKDRRGVACWQVIHRHSFGMLQGGGTTMARTTRDKFLDAVNESYSALLSVIDATEMRGHKVSRTVIAEARKGEREVADLTRKLVDEPASFFDNMEAVIEAQANAQRRALELARESLGGAEEYRHDVRQALARVIAANREATQAMAVAMRQATRGAYTQTATRMRGAATRVRSAATRARGAAGVERRKPRPTRAAPARRARARKRPAAPAPVTAE